jgi:23S rRNA (guanosine2251-2'-O)-methyltransferase
MNQKLSMDQLGRMLPVEFQQSEKIPVMVVLENIRSGLNVGSVFRSADAFKIEAIICTGYTPCPPHREVLKTALGATETVAWSYDAGALEVVERAQATGTACYAIEQTSNSISLQEFAPQSGKKILIVFGNEVSGVSQPVIDRCGQSLEITQFGTKHSLNVSVCAGIVLYDLQKKLAAKG